MLFPRVTQSMTEGGQVDLAETNENGKGRQDNENCGKGRRFRK